MNATFQPSEELTRIAEAYALDTVDLMAASFGKTADFSPTSVDAIEEALDTYSRSLPDAKPSDETVLQFAKGFGSYVGEVLRKHYGATWGYITLDGKQAPGMRCADGSLVWPWARVFRRLKDGAEENVAHYFAQLTKT